jgi:hypothetical protein
LKIKIGWIGVDKNNEDLMFIPVEIQNK